MKLILQPLRNSGLVLSTASVPWPRYVAFIHYIQHLLTHIVVMPYSWILKYLKDELNQNQTARARVKNGNTPVGSPSLSIDANNKCLVKSGCSWIGKWSHIVNDFAWVPVDCGALHTKPAVDAYFLDWNRTPRMSAKGGCDTDLIT